MIRSDSAIVSGASAELWLPENSTSTTRAGEYLWLAILTSAGVMSVTVAPALMQALASIGISDREAGMMVAYNYYGLALGAFLAMFLVRLEPGRRHLVWLVGILGASDLLCLFTGDASLLLPLRVVAGLSGGLVTGTGFAMMARTTLPSRGFGGLVAYQVLLSGATLMLLPLVVPHLGTDAIFGALLLFDLLALIALKWLPERNFRLGAAGRQALKRMSLSTRSLTALGALCLVQAGNMAIFTYYARIGTLAGHSPLWIGWSSGALVWGHLPGAIVVVLLGARLNRVISLCAGFCVSVLGIVMMYFADVPILYLSAGILIALAWGFIPPLLLEICAALDSAGRVAVLGGVASKIGLATGPMLVAMFLTVHPVTVAMAVALGLTLLGGGLSLRAALITRSTRGLNP